MSFFPIFERMVKTIRRIAEEKKVRDFNVIAITFKCWIKENVWVKILQWCKLKSFLREVPLPLSSHLLKAFSSRAKPSPATC